MTITEFLAARLDEDAQAARAATEGPWRHNPDKHHHLRGTPVFEEAVFAGPVGQDATCVAGTGETDDPQSMRDADHIARHDPEQVLRDVAAKRSVIDAYLRDKAHNEALNLNYGAWVNNNPEPYPEVQGGEKKTVPGLEMALRLVAAAYADHPDYLAEWRP